MSDSPFSEPLADSRDYPPPRFSALPTLGYGNPLEVRPAPHRVGRTFMAHRARYALAFIAKAELSTGDTVLLPAYHCPAMIEPFIWAGCKVAYYHMTADLRPNYESLTLQLKKARAVVFVRYFGFDCNIDEFVELAVRERCMVIEDLAHSAFAKQIYGDYAVTSLPKFYPVDTGAEIYVNELRDKKPLQRTIENSKQNSIFWHIRYALKKMGQKLDKYSLRRAYDAEAFRYFDPLDMERPAQPTQAPQRAEDLNKEIMRKRHDNYIHINDGLIDSEMGKPLFPTPDSDSAPYVYPFLLHESGTFDLIRGSAIPLFRWEELAATDCTISQQYRHRLIQIPCHQDLTEADIDYTVSILKGSLARKNLTRTGRT